VLEPRYYQRRHYKNVRTAIHMSEHSKCIGMTYLKDMKIEHTFLNERIDPFF
jgi:hypothetical protein